MEDVEPLMSQHPRFNYEFCPLPNKIDGLRTGVKTMTNSRISKEGQLQWLYGELGHK